MKINLTKEKKKKPPPTSEKRSVGGIAGGMRDRRKIGGIYHQTRKKETKEGGVMEHRGGRIGCPKMEGAIWTIRVSYLELVVWGGGKKSVYGCIVQISFDAES